MWNLLKLSQLMAQNEILDQEKNSSETAQPAPTR